MPLSRRNMKQPRTTFVRLNRCFDQWQRTFGFIVSAFALCAISPVANAEDGTPNPRQSQTQQSETVGVSVVELFTSQGCSSCPSADRVLTKLADLRKTNNASVFCLSLHVDYWNRLGWTDPFSKASYSSRQRAYAKHFGSSRVYTPQMIVNGQTEFVGSHAKKAFAVVESNLAQPATCHIQLTAKRVVSSKAIRVQHKITGDTKDAVLVVACIRKTGENEVPVGENAGRTLTHTNIVHEMKFARLGEATETDLKFAAIPNVAPSQLALIGFVQDTKTLNIRGATELSLSE